jgi:mannosyltransferase
LNRLRFHPPVIASATLILVVGLLLRCVYLDQRSIWFDEASSWLTSTFSFSELIASLRQSTHVPLYYPLLRGWMWCFGESPVAMRSLSVVFGMLTVAGCWPLGTLVFRLEQSQELQSPKRGQNARVDDGVAELEMNQGRQSNLDNGADAVWFGLFCAAICATCAFQVHASVEARMYSLGTFLFVVSNYTVLRIVQSPDRLRLWSLLVGVTIAEVYTHHFLAMTAGIQAVWLFVQLIPSGEVVRRSSNSIVAEEAGLIEKARLLTGHQRYWLVSVVLVTVAWMPGLVLWWAQFGRIRKGFWISPLTEWTIPRTLLEFLIGSIPGLRGQMDWLAVFITVVGLLLVLRAAIVCRAAIGLMLLQGIVPMIAVWFVSVFTPIWQARYFRFAFIGVMISIAWVIWNLTRSDRKRQILCALTLTICAAGSTVFWLRRDIPHRQAMRGAIGFIATREEAPESARLIVTRPMEFVIARYYAPHFGFERKHVSIWTGGGRQTGFAGHLIGAQDWWEPDANQKAAAVSAWTIFPSTQPQRIGRQDPLSPVFESDLHLTQWSVQAARFDLAFLY